MRQTIPLCNNRKAPGDRLRLTLLLYIRCYVYCRLYVKGVFMGYQRGLRTQTTHTALVKIQDLQDKNDVDFYLGKRIAYIYKASHVRMTRI
jgi:hypothetical protein